MEAKKAAEILDNTEYPVRVSDDLIKAAKDQGLVIVYGDSDDLMEFEGAIYDEVGCYGGGSAFVDSEGLLPDRESIDGDHELERFFARKPNAKEIKAIWGGEDDYSWTYQTEIPHETFEVVEDGGKYCRGIVFALSDVEVK
jgi:hypothetical protein